VLGLRWSDIGLRASRLTVNQARVLVEYRVRIEEPQSRNGKRSPPPRSHPHLDALGAYWDLLYELLERAGVLQASQLALE
jgi:hypothetical protein